MNIRTFVWLPVVLLGIGGAALAPSAAAHTSFHISLRFGPPAPRFERAPPPRVGYVWAPGHWRWSSGRYVWLRGRWLAQRAGYVYVAPRWERHGGSWRFQASHWAPRSGWRRGGAHVRYRHRGWHNDRWRHDNRRHYARRDGWGDHDRRDRDRGWGDRDRGWGDDD